MHADSNRLRRLALSPRRTDISAMLKIALPVAALVGALLFVSTGASSAERAVPIPAPAADVAAA